MMAEYMEVLLTTAILKAGHKCRAVGSYLRLVQPEQPRGVWGHAPPGKFYICML